jgi:multidrug efflux pump subunit AcrB
LKKGAGMAIETFKEKFRASVQQSIPEAQISFEPGDMVEQVINLGTTNPIEIAVMGKNLSQSRKVAEKLNSSLGSIQYLRDVQIATPLDYPGIKFNIDRVKAGQLGLTVDQVNKSMVAATSSSRFTQPNYWLDKSSGTAYQVQVEYPQYRINSADELGLIPLTHSVDNPVYLRDVASSQSTVSPGEYDRINQQRFITITANINQKDAGAAIKDVKQAIASLGELPAGVKIMLRGQADLLEQTMRELATGLMIAIVVIFLMLAVNFQSFKLSLVVLSVIPAVIAGSLLLLFLTGNTLNIQSYMGMIMAVGVAVANAILLVTKGEQLRRQDASTAFAIPAAASRLRPILMTSLAMIAGMVPMAIGSGQGGDQTSPLGLAVIGGLALSTISTLIFLPAIYSGVMSRKPYGSKSLDPDDINSIYYSPDQR